MLASYDKLRNYILWFLSTVLFTQFEFTISGCRPQASKLDIALSAAGKNRIEFEKVLNKYSINPADSLKYKSAIFLIENMPGYSYYYGEGISNYKSYFKALRFSKSTPVAILDSITQIFGQFELGNQKKMYDIETIDSNVV